MSLHAFNPVLEQIVRRMRLGMPLDFTKVLSIDDFRLYGDSVRALKEEVNDGNFCVMLQCGGFGIRSESPGPKHLAKLGNECTVEVPPQFLSQESLFELWNNERPLSNLLRDIPTEIPIYIHLLREQRYIFKRFINGFYGFGHKVGYIYQHEVQMFNDREGSIPLEYPDGTRISGTDGPGTFAQSFARYRFFGLPRIPEYCFVTDGAKFGVDLEDIAKAFIQLKENKDIDVVVFSRPINNEKRLEEAGLIGKQGKHPRFGYARTYPMKVLEHPGKVTEDAVMNWTPIGGAYVMRMKNYMEEAASKKGEIAKGFSADTLWQGYAPYFKITMCLEGYNCEGDGYKPGLRFTLYEPKHYISGLKKPEDIISYLAAKEKGVFSFRKWCIPQK